MNIDRYYRNAAAIHLNGSIVSLIPPFFIVIGNVFILESPGIMLFTMPFLMYSLIQFQLYLYRRKQALSIKLQLLDSEGRNNSLFDASDFLVFYENFLFSPRLLLFFSDGSLAASIQAAKAKQYPLLKNEKCYVLLNAENQLRGIFKATLKEKRVIEVYNEKKIYAGKYEVVKRGWMLLEEKKEVLDSTGRFVGGTVGSRIFMDEHLFDGRDQEIGRLRRGWMPLNWGKLFPDANTPVFSLSPRLSRNEKLLRFALLTDEFFIKR